MRVQHVVAPRSGAVSYTVVDENFIPVAPAEAYLAHLCALERSPNTLRAYASSLKLFFEHLESRGVAFEDVRIDEVGRFVQMLRAPAPGVIVIDANVSHRAPSTVNRHLAAVFGLYEFHARRGVTVADELVSWRRGGRGSYRPFLDQVGGRARQVARRPVRLRDTHQLPKTLTVAEVAALLAACAHRRDRFLLGLLAETGMFSGGRFT